MNRLYQLYCRLRWPHSRMRQQTEREDGTWDVGPWVHGPPEKIDAMVDSMREQALARGDKWRRY